MSLFIYNFVVPNIIKIFWIKIANAAHGKRDAVRNVIKGKKIGRAHRWSEVLYNKPVSPLASITKKTKVGGETFQSLCENWNRCTSTRFETTGSQSQVLNYRSVQMTDRWRRHFGKSPTVRCVSYKTSVFGKAPKLLNVGLCLYMWRPGPLVGLHLFSSRRESYQ